MSLSYDELFETRYQSGNGLVRRHFLVDVTTIDYRLPEEITQEKAKEKMRVDSMPTLGNINDPLRQVVFLMPFMPKVPICKLTVFYTR